MGLDAIVYRNVHNLENAYGQDLFQANPETGEAALMPSATLNLPDDAYYAVEKRLGNVAHVNHLSRLVEARLPADAVTVKQVLYSASHCGDWIPLADMPRLQQELQELRHSDDPDLNDFIVAMQALVDAAQRETNPIVFV